ncbi:MAG: TipJ family phage tail tip protein, partial [Caulobacterales bacterium]|uniref:TipJ family phage tail tip protein n=1 Tax=Glycocaulis sp. TaxID=1969725 RepID=UPI003FA00954
GGDGGKILRTILQIAVIAAAAWVTAGAGGLLTAGSWQAAAAAATVAVAGNLAINALVPPPQLDLGAREIASPTYSVDGARNVAARWQPMPVLFGEHRIYPPLQGEPWQEVVGDDTYLRYLLNLGPRGLEIDTDTIRIGETPLSEYQGVEIEIDANEGDAPVTLYQNDPFTESVGALLNPGNAVVRVSQTEATELVAILVFPQGLGEVDSKGNNRARSVTLQMRYRPAGSTSEADWINAGASAPQANAAATALDTDRFHLFESNSLLDWSGALPGGTPALTQTVNRSEPGKPFRIVMRAAVPAGQYEVEIRRTSAAAGDGKQIFDAVQWLALRTVSARDPMPLKQFAYMAIRVKASDQLSGFVDTINLVATRKAPVLSAAIADDEDADLSLVTPDDWTGLAATRNPADLLAFLYRGPHTARPRPNSRINWPSLAAFRKWCIDQNFTCDLVVDVPMTRRAAAELICACGRARPLDIKGELHVVIDGPRASGPRQLFTPRSTRGFRWRKVWTEDVHALRIPFVNREAGWREDEMLVFADGYSRDGEVEGTIAATAYEELRLPGRTNPSQIWRDGRFYLYTARLQAETHEFEEDVEAIVSRYGDLAELAHDVMAVGLGTARVTGHETDDGEVTALLIDEAGQSENGLFVMQAGTDYGIRWRTVRDADGGGQIIISDSVRVETVAGPVERLTFLEPVPLADAPRVGDVVTFGEFERETLPVLIKHYRPGARFSAAIEAVAYAPQRFEADTGTVPEFDSGVTLPRIFTPPAPTLGEIWATADGIFVSFTVPDSVAGRIDRFEWRLRKQPEEGSDARFEPQANLPATARQLALPPGVPGWLYDVEIVAVAGERRSPALRVSGLGPSLELPQPQNVTVTPHLFEGIEGTGVPGVRLSWTPVEDPRITTLVVYARPASSSDPDDYRPVDTEPAADGKGEVRGLPPGLALDFGFALRDQRGVVSTPLVEVSDIEIPLLKSWDAHLPSLLLEDARQLMAEALGLDGLDFDQLSGLIADRARLGGRNAVLNRVADPLFVNGVDAWKPETGGLAVLPGGAPQAIFTAGDAGEVLSWRWPVRLVVEPGDWLQASADILFAAGGSAQLVAVIRDADGEVIATLNLGEAVSTDTRAGGVAEISRASEAGFADAAMADIELRFTAPAAGVVFIGLDRPFAGFALPGQAEPTAFLPPDAEINATIARLERAVNGTAEIAQSAQVATQQGRADVTRIDRALFDEDGFLAEALELLAGEIESDIAAVYATNEELDSAFVSFEEAIAFDLSTLETSLQGEISTRASLSDLALVQSDLEGSLAAFNLALSAEIDGLGSDFDLAAIAIANLESKTSSFWLRVAAGDGWAGMQAYAEDANGVQVSYFRYAAQRFIYGTDYTDAGIRDDWNYPAGYKAAYAPWGTLIEYHDLVGGTKHWYRASDGVETMNSEQGLLASGVAPFLATQGPASTTTVANSSMTDSWLTVCEVSLNSVPDNGKFHAAGHIEWVQQQSTSPVAVASVQYRVIALNAASAELEFPSPVTNSPMSWEVDPSPDPKIYYVGLPYAPFNFVVAQPAGTFTGNLVFRLQARRISGSGPIAVQSARLSVTRQF